MDSMTPYVHHATALPPPKPKKREREREEKTVACPVRFCVRALGARMEPLMFNELKIIATRIPQHGDHDSITRCLLLPPNHLGMVHLGGGTWGILSFPQSTLRNPASGVKCGKVPGRTPPPRRGALSWEEFDRRTLLLIRPRMWSERERPKKATHFEHNMAYFPPLWKIWFSHRLSPV